MTLTSVYLKVNAQLTANFEGQIGAKHKPAKHKLEECLKCAIPSLNLRNTELSLER